MRNEAQSYLIHKFIVLAISIFSAFPLYAGIVYADSLFTSGPTSRPHQIFTDLELLEYDLPTYDAKTYWIVNSSNLDEEILDDESCWGLLYNDFYRYYHNADINVSTELKKKVFEKSALYNEFRNDMDFTRDILISDTIHMPLHNFVGYAREYDVKRGGFLIREELDAQLPPFFTNKPSKARSKNKDLFVEVIDNPILNGTDYPQYLKIPSSLKGKIESFNGRNFSFFIPIANEEIAVQIEDMNHPFENSFDLLMQFHYVQANTPYIELVDVILLSNKDKRIIWTLDKGDLSNMK